jgi:thiamine-monophosphate kinase
MSSGRRLRDVGEDALVAEITRDLPKGKQVRVGAADGDDCAVIGGPRDRWWRLLKTDAVVEGVHFTCETEPARIGWKALCRAISDIGAMGGIPEHALITVAVSRDLSLDWMRQLYRGLRKAAAQFDVTIVGGETSRSPGPTFINVAIEGRVERTRCVLRSGGRAGDVLFVTGTLGGSRAGKHLDFTPRIAEARWLATRGVLRAMMDLSDGLAADLPRLARASGCGFQVFPENVPCTRGCSLEQALADGEDFELLFAVAPDAADALEKAWKRAFPRVPLSRVGVLTKPSATGSSFNVHGYDHFT